MPYFGQKYRETKSYELLGDEIINPCPSNADTRSKFGVIFLTISSDS